MYHKIHKIHVHFTRAAVALSILIVLTSIAAAMSGELSTTKAASSPGLTWKSGLFNNGAWENIAANTKKFGDWRGQPAEVVVTWPNRETWDGLMGNSFNYYTDQLKKNPSTTYAIGMPFFPEGTNHNGTNKDGSPGISNAVGLQQCAAGSYDSQWKTIATILRSKGLDNSIIRLSWEFNGDWYNHRASNPEQFKQCWVKVVTAARTVAPNLKWDWNANRGNNMLSNTEPAYPGNQYVDYVGVDSYDFYNGARNDAEWNNNQYNSNYGLKWYLDFAKSHGKRLSVAEWGIYPANSTSAGDNPFYIQKMFEFFKANASSIAYEAYFNENASYYAGAIYNPVQNAAASGKYLSLYKAGVAGTTPAPTPTPPAPTPTPPTPPTPMPPAPAPVTPFGPGTYNDTTFKCSDGWLEGPGDAMYQKDNRYSGKKDAYCTVTFTGNKIALYMIKYPSHGIVAVSIDGGTETMIDLYSPTRISQFLAYTSSSTLSNGTHTAKMRITGNKSSAATGSYVGLDRADISNDVQETPLSRPTNLTAIASSATSVSLKWTKSEGSVAKYLIQRDGNIIGETTALTYVDNGRAAKTTYSYTIVAVGTNGSASQPSEATEVTTPDVKDATPPSTPTNIVATAISPIQINVSWSPSSDNIGVAGYKIYRDNKQVGNVDVNTKSYGDTSLRPSTSYSYTVAAYDGSGNASAQSSPAVIVVTPALTNPTSTGLVGMYFPSKNMSGTPITRTDSTINFNWGSGSPISNIPADLFSAKWTGGITPPTTGTYTFTTKGDDGMRLWVNDKLVVNDWSDHSMRERSGTIKLYKDITYNIKLEYYENKRSANAQLLWAGPTISKSVIGTQYLSPEFKGLTAHFYNNPTLAGSPVTTRIDSSVDFSWGNNAPIPGVDVDNFSAQWTGKVIADKAGEYTFSTLSDDGVKLTVNGKLIINNWNRHAETENVGKIRLEANSRNDIRLDFNDVANAATIKLYWTTPGKWFKTILAEDYLRTR